MIGSFLARILILAFGYAYPAYECYKTVEKNKPRIDQLQFWCQYWILVALLTVFERFSDAFISWLPLYNVGKLAFYVYLWYPKTRGATCVYEKFFRPYVAKHEVEIDRNLLELRARAGDAVVLYLNKAATYGQARFFEIFQNAVSYCKSSKYGGGPAQKQHEQDGAHQQNNAPSLPALVPSTKPSSSAPSRKETGEPLPSHYKDQTAAEQVQHKGALVSQMQAKSQSTSSSRLESATSPTKSRTCSIPADAAEIPAKSQPRSTHTELAPTSSRNKSPALSVSTSSSKTSGNDSIKLSEVNTRPST